MASEPVSLSDAGWGNEGRLEDHGPTHRRRKRPIDRAVLWTPRGMAESTSDERPPGSGPYEFYVQQSVIAGINRHLDGVDEEPHFGFLLGHVCRCPTTKVRYSVADTVIAAQEALVEEASGAFLIRAWAEARSVFDVHSGVLLGWYHSHHLLGLMLSVSDEEVNERFFGQPWQASIVVVPDSKSPLGGVFRLYPDGGVAERRRPSPFYELHGRPVDTTGDDVETAVIWTNYEIGCEEPSDEAQDPPAVVERVLDDPTLDEPYLPPLVIPGEGPELDLQPANRRRKLVPLVVFGLVMVTVAAVTVMRGLDRTPVTLLPQVQTVRTLDQRRLFASIDGLTIAVERYDERAIDFDAGRITCDLLATGYAAADAAFVETATNLVALGAEPGREAQDAYEAASAEIAIVNNHFDGSGCPRP